MELANKHDEYAEYDGGLDASDFDELEEDWMDLANFIFDQWTPIWARKPYNKPSHSELIKLDLTSDIEEILEEYPIFVIVEEED